MDALIAKYDQNEVSIKKALDKGANAIADKWTQSQWETAEKMLNAFDNRLKKVMLGYVRSLFGISNVTESENTYKVLGDDFFTLLQKRLLEEKLISPSVKSDTSSTDDSKSGDKSKSKKDKKEKVKVEKKADIIKRENSWAMINKELDGLIKSFKLDDDFHVPHSLLSKFIEIRGVGFLLCAQYLIHNKKKFLGKQSKLLFVNNIIVGIQKFINSSRNFDGDSIVDSAVKLVTSSKFLDEMQRVLDVLKKTYDYDGMKVCINTPQLLIFTDYDHCIPKKTSSLYPHQSQMIDAVYNSIKNDTPLLISLRTMTGTGKTASACGIAEVVNCFRKYNKKEDIMLVFCCNVRQVMDQVAQLVYNSTIPFGIAVIDQYVGLKEINNYNCPKDSDRVVTVCGPDACIEILKKYPNCVLFLDELTIGLDHKTSIAKTNVKLISEYLPKWTILSSATLPEKLPQWIIDNHEIKHGKTDFIDIYSNKIHIACEIKTLDGNLMIAHSGCKTSEDLATTITQIKANPFIGRSYTSNMSNALHKILIDNKITDIPNIKDIFDNTDNLNADSLRSISMEMLTSVCNSDNISIKKICNTDIKPRNIDYNEDNNQDLDEDIAWEKEEKFAIGNDIDYTKLCTSAAHRFMRPTLIATLDPVKFVHENFANEDIPNIIKDFIKEFGTVKQINDQYEQELSIWQKQVERSEKSMEDASIKSKEDRLRKTENLQSEKPKININGFQINTIDHIKKYAKNTKNRIEKSAVRNDIDVTEIMTVPMDVPDSVRILLACGIGIIGKYSGRYTSFVRNLMDDGKLAYIVADSSIAYGTNVPINCVIVTKEFSDNHSINTIYQLISRAGRVGRSWYAEAFVDNTCAATMIDSIQRNNIKHNVELANLEEIHDELVSTSNDIDDALILELARKKMIEIEQERKEQERLQKEEEERLKLEAEKKLREEEEQKKLQELRMRRNGGGNTRSLNTTSLSNIVNDPPLNTTTSINVNPIAAGFQRSSGNNFTRKVPTNNRGGNSTFQQRNK